MKTNFNTRKFRGGAYATVLSAVVLAILIFVNLIVSGLGLTVDLTSGSKYSLTEETVSMLEALEDDITVYYLAPSTESIDWFDKILGQYAKHSGHLTLITKDPEINPKFAAQYTEEDIESFSLIVVNEATGRSRYIPCSDMILTETSLDYSTYQYVTKQTGLDMEGQLNSAIAYVTSGHLPTLYQVTGHGEQTLGSNTLAMLEKANILVESITLLTASEIPEDCDVLLIHTPQNDFAASEITLLEEYKNRGGKIIFALSYMDTEHPALSALVNSFGIELTDGILMEENTRYYMQSPNYLLPVKSSNSFTSNLADKYIIAQVASGLTKKDEAGENVNFTEILSTSSTAYSKSTNATTFYKEEGDPSGKFYVGLYAEDSLTGAGAAVYSALYLFYDDYAASSAFGNINLLINTVNTLSKTDTSMATVRTISLEEDSYLLLTEAQANTIGAIVVIVLPLGILVAGICFVVYRRKHA